MNDHDYEDDLREHFAGLAMQAMLIKDDSYSATGAFPDGLAGDAVRVADALVNALRGEDLEDDEA